jgi:hypothetical protein
MSNEGSLHCVQVFWLTDSLNGRDLVTLIHRGEAKTWKHASTIDVDGARAALAVVASLLRSSQMQMFAETIEQRRAPIDSQIVFLSVYTQRDGNCVLRLR